MTYTRERFSVLPGDGNSPEKIRAAFQRVQRGIPHPLYRVDARDFDTDPRGTNDSAAGIQQMITQAETTGIPYLPEGTYGLNTAILLGTDNALVGAASRQAILKPANGQTAIKLNGSVGGGVYNWRLRNLRIDGSLGASIGIDLQYAREGYMHGLDIRNCGTGISGTQAWSNGIAQSHVVSNTGANIQLNAQCNDWDIEDVQLDAAGTYGLYITADCQRVAFRGVVQSCGKSGIYAVLVRALSVNAYFEQNNTTATAGEADIKVDQGYGVSAVGCMFWPKLETVVIALDSVRDVMVAGCSQGLVAGYTTSYFLQTTANTQDVMRWGVYTDTLTDNDVGNALTSSRAPIFHGSGGIRAANATWSIDTPDTTTNPTLALKSAGTTKLSLTQDATSGDAFLGHYNTLTPAFENALRVNGANEFDFLTHTVKNCAVEHGSTASRPTIGYTGRPYVDTTVSKLLISTSIGWLYPTGSMAGNVRGSVTISGASTSSAVTFGTAENDINYTPNVTVTATSGTPAAGATRCYVTSKAVGGFTINVEVAPGVGNSVTVEWTLIR